ncbi:MAG: hypothetical protein HY912_14185 [Desulfomonile tiedjei]|uniref:Uncharacterized protein n=1 Tax=Desulfomonile tiedjei TaxID=2358 RepID=A0A9D6Z475_9BACT|nr:hypothetical protein [Desulfomonile tiedjei]
MIETTLDKTKDEFLESFFESASKVRNVWMRQLGNLRAVFGSNGPEWMNPAEVTQWINLSSFALKFRGAANAAFMDLPLIPLNKYNSAKIQQIRKKWGHSNEESIRPVFGLPVPTGKDVPEPSESVETVKEQIRSLQKELEVLRKKVDARDSSDPRSCDVERL